MNRRRLLSFLLLRARRAGGTCGGTRLTGLDAFGPILVEALSKLIDAALVHGVNPALVQEDEENDVIPEARDAMHPRHLDDEREQVIDDGVERLVHERTHRQMRDTLQLVVDVHGGDHEQEPERVHGAYERTQNPGVPRLVLLVHQRVDAVQGDEGVSDPGEVLHGLLVVLLGLLGVRVAVLGLEPGDDAEELDLAEVGELDGLAELPDLDGDADSVADDDHPRRVVIQQVQEDDDLHEDLHAHAAHADALHALDALPVAHVVAERQRLQHAVRQAHDHRHGQQHRVSVEDHPLDLVLLLRARRPVRNLHLHRRVELRLQRPLLHRYRLHYHLDVRARHRAVNRPQHVGQQPKLVHKQRRVVRREPSRLVGRLVPMRYCQWEGVRREWRVVRHQPYRHHGLHQLNNLILPSRHHHLRHHLLVLLVAQQVRAFLDNRALVPRYEVVRGVENFRGVGVLDFPRALFRHENVGVPGRVAFGDLARHLQRDVLAAIVFLIQRVGEALRRVERHVVHGVLERHRAVHRCEGAHVVAHVGAPDVGAHGLAAGGLRRRAVGVRGVAALVGAAVFLLIHDVAQGEVHEQRTDYRLHHGLLELLAVPQVLVPPRRGAVPSPIRAARCHRHAVRARSGAVLVTRFSSSSCYILRHRKQPRGTASLWVSVPTAGA